MNRLRFFPDFGRAGPLWDARGVGVKLDMLPLRPETNDALRAWCARWEPLARRQLDADDGAAGVTKSTVDGVPSKLWHDIGVEGQRLCAAVQEELGAEWEVRYEGPR